MTFVIERSKFVETEPLTTFIFNQSNAEVQHLHLYCFPTDSSSICPSETVTSGVEKYIPPEG